MGVLDSIIAQTRSDLIDRKSQIPDSALEKRLDAVRAAKPVLPRLRSGFGVISEVKRSSPSKGALADIPDPAALATHYAAGGAAAISVLTEPHRFGGSLADLEQVRAAVDTPILRKDFIVDRYQIMEARAAGADLILLIAAALDDTALEQLLLTAHELELTVLVEAHTEDETRRAVDSGAQLIGINNRNLQTLEVDLSQFERLIHLVPQQVVKVAESGIFTTADVTRVVTAGADAILVGEALVTQGNPRDRVAAFTAAGKARQTEKSA